MTYPQNNGQQGSPYGQQFGGMAPQNYQQLAPQTQGTYVPPQQGQQFGQYQQQSAPTGQQNAPDFDDAADPSGFGGLFARPRHLVGRVVIYMPKRVDDKARGIDGNAKDTPNVHGDLIVVDGGMIEFGDKLKSGGVVVRPCTHRVMAPAFFRNVIVGETQIALALQQAAPPFGNGLMVGVIVIGQQGNNPFLLQTLERDDPRRNAARELYNAWKAGTWTPPEIEPIQVVPGSQAQNMSQGQQAGQWGQPQSMGGQTTGWTGTMAPQNGPQTVNASQPTQWGQQPQFGQQGPAQGPQQGFSQQPQGQQDFGQGGYGSEQWRQLAPGWDPNMWAQLADTNKQQVWAAIQQQQAHNGAQVVPGATSGPTGF